MNGNIYIVGGWNLEKPINSAEYFNPKIDKLPA